MNKITIACHDPLILHQIEKVMVRNGYSYNVQTSNIRRSLMYIDILIIHSSLKLPNLHKFVEGIVYEKKVVVIYLNHTNVTGMFYNLMDDPNFHIIGDRKIDVELQILIKTIMKYYRKLNVLEEKVDNLKDRVNTDKMMRKAKRYLINCGMTEEEAHKYIIKIAMDRRLSKLKASEYVLLNYFG